MPDNDGSANRRRFSFLPFRVVGAAYIEKLRSIEQEVDQNLIPWRVSLKHELTAKEVWCLTPNLKWARAHVDLILRSLRSDDRKIFRYIVFDNKALSNSDEALENARYILREAAKDSKIARRNGVEILFLTRDGEPCLWRPSDGAQRQESEPSRWAYLPIPTDIAVFVDTPVDPDNLDSNKRTFAVMSVVPIDDAISSLLVDAVPTRHRSEFDLDSFTPASQQYDIQLQRSEHYNPIKDWFVAEWNNRTATS